MNVLFWFRHDLRIHDNAALCRAAGLGAVVPLYIFDPDLWAQPDRSARQFLFICEALEDLRSDLALLDAALLIRTGPPLVVLQRVCARHAITRIVTEAPPPLVIAQWAATAGIEWDVVAPSPTGDPLPPPALLCPAGLVTSQLPAAQSLRLAPDPCAHRQRGGRAQALELLDTFLTTRGEGYHHAQSQPMVSERASSRLSPHLAQGSLSLREITTAISVRLAEQPNGRWAAALTRFQAQLDRRTPQSLVENQAVHVSASRWLTGETGLPFLDACMRYLAATGWLNQHLRACVLSIACHHLGFDWQGASTALAARLTDYDPQIFWPQAGMIAGPAQQAPRLFHPIKQGLDLDPTGAFTRRWLPELSPVPDTCLQTPWRWAGAARLLGHRYPEPMIDANTAHRDAREAIWARHGKPLRGLATSPMHLIEATSQPAKGQLRLEF